GHSVTLTSTDTPPSTSVTFSSSGLTAGRISSSLRTSESLDGMASSIASERRRSRPTAASTTGRGALPGRKPFNFRSCERRRAAAFLAASISASVNSKPMRRSKGPASRTVTVMTLLIGGSNGLGGSNSRRPFAGAAAPWGDRGDLNPRPPGPQPGALTGLSYGHREHLKCTGQGTERRTPNPSSRATLPRRLQPGRPTATANTSTTKGKEPSGEPRTHPPEPHSHDGSNQADLSPPPTPRPQRARNRAASSGRAQGRSTPGGTRTPNRRIRSPLLYPIDLQGRVPTDSTVGTRIPCSPASWKRE